VPAKLLNLPLPCAKPAVPGDFQDYGGVFIPDPVQDPSRSSRLSCELQVIQSPAQRLLSWQRCEWWMGAPAGRDQYHHFHLFIRSWPSHFLYSSLSSSLRSKLSQEMFLGYFWLVSPVDFFFLSHYSYLNFSPIIQICISCSHHRQFLLSFSDFPHYC